MISWFKNITLILKISYCLLTALFISTSHGVRSQNAVQFSQYFSNQLVLNPAYAGADDALSLTMVHRNQWSGVDGAPVTMTFAGHTLFKNENTGLGFNLFSDRINIHSNTSLSGIYSYRVKTSDKSYLSFGLQAGINNVRSDYSSLAGGINDLNDPNILSENISESAFQFGTGVYFKSRKLEVGLSAPVLYSTDFRFNIDTLTRPILDPHYFLFSRVKFQVSPQVRLNPGFLLKKKADLPLSADLNIDAWFKEVLMAGFSYRLNETVSCIMQIKILPQMKFGYSYDIPLNRIQRVNFNSHEFMLNYIFQYKDYGVYHPR